MVTNPGLLTAIIERILEQTKKKHPGVELVKKPKEPKVKKPRKKKALH